MYFVGSYRFGVEVEEHPEAVEVGYNHILAVAAVEEEAVDSTVAGVAVANRVVSVVAEAVVIVKVHNR